MWKWKQYPTWFRTFRKHTNHRCKVFLGGIEPVIGVIVDVTPNKLVLSRPFSDEEPHSKWIEIRISRIVACEFYEDIGALAGS